MLCIYQSSIHQDSTTGIKEWIVLFSVPRDGNKGLENAIIRPWRTESKELRSLFSVPGDGHSGVNPGGVLGSGPHQLFPLPGSAYWWTLAQFSQNTSIS